ncbi:MAG: dihydrodipicolinate synthase family protein [Gammaproteobacteria bacterium]
MTELTGVCVPICTPFDKTGENLDETALKNHIDSMLEAGVHIILVCGGTGEFPYLRAEEKRRVAEIAARHIDGRAAFMVQTSAISTSETIEFSKHAEGLGADAVMVLPPYFEGPDMEGVYYHYEQVARAIKTPLMVYNIPQASNINVDPEMFKRLLKIDNIEYIKDSTSDLTQIQALLRTGGKVFNGGDPITFQALLSGCPGCVWGAVNAMPNEAVELYNLVRAGKLLEAKELWDRIFPSQYFFWTHVYNPAIKAATNMSGRPVGNCRMPVQPLTAEEMKELEAALKPLGFGQARAA